MRDWSRMRVAGSSRSSALDQRAVDAAAMLWLRIERAAALVLPGAGHRRQAGRGEHLHRAVALARKAVAEPQISCASSRRRAGRNRRSALPASPVIAAAHAGVRLARCASSPAGIVGVARQVGAVGVAFLEQHMHHGAGERAVGAGQQRQMHVGQLGGAGAVRIDDDELRAALLARLRDHASSH